MKKKCLWLINHQMLANWELPLLRDSGYDYIYTPQKIPHNPIFTSGTVDQITGLSNVLTKTDLDSLGKQNWYEKIEENVSFIIQKISSKCLNMTVTCR
jgi:hypothetical protein